MAYDADRLRLIAPLAGLTSDTALVRLLRIKHSRWSNYVNGTHQLPVDVALRLVEAIPGLSLDWIYRGTTDGLSGPLRQRLRKLRELQTILAQGD